MHTFFGDYDNQAGDGTPTVPRFVAQAAIVSYTTDAMRQFG